MADTGPPKRTLPARAGREREPAAKRRASSPMQPPASTPSSRKPSTPAPSSEPRQKRKYTKRASLVRVQTPASRSSPSLSVAEEVLPTRVGANKPLPTSRQKQPANLSRSEYQSIAESAVLAASLHRSRMQWLCDGIFPKYWVKPVKRKGVIEAPPNNPDVKSMQKLGTATITIEPHVFDAVFYTVKDPSAPQPFPRHPNQHTTKTMIPPRPTYGYPPPPGAYPIPPAQRPPAPPPAPQPPSAPPATSPPPPTQTAQPAAPPPVQRPQTPLASVDAGYVSGTPKQHPPSGATSDVPPPPQNPPPASTATETTQTPNGPQKQANPPPGGRGSTTDPVIQMLAARAASDPKLKELMKVVATSRASPEQLKEFQAHIDEFNEVVRRQEAERKAKGDSQVAGTTSSKSAGPAQAQDGQLVKSEATPPKPNQPIPPVQAPRPSPAPAAAHPSTYNAPATQSRPPQPPSGSTTFPGVMHTFPPAPHAGGGPMGGFMGYHAPPPPPRPEPIIKHIVMEITSTPSSTQPACPDRWLFPEYAVLEIRFGGLEMLCSFLVERRGSQILSGMSSHSAEQDEDGNQVKWKPEQEYYETVTMTVKATHHRTIETIARAAKPLPVVQDYMKQVLGRAERAPKEYLIHQLPREIGSEGTEAFVDSGVELGNESPSEDDELKDVYGI